MLLVKIDLCQVLQACSSSTVTLTSFQADTIHGFDAWKDLAVHVKANEPNCQTYYFGTPEEYGGNHSASNFILSFEQYLVREDLYETHLHSKPMEVFRSII